MADAAVRAERRMGGFSSLPQALRYAATAFPDQGFSYFDGQGQLSARMGYGELWRRACAVAVWMRTGIAAQRGTRIGLLAQTGPDFIVHFCACQLLGWVPCPLPLPASLQGASRYQQALANLQAAAGIELLIGPRQLLASLQTGMSGLAGLDYEATAHLGGDEATCAAAWQAGGAPEPSDVAYVQFSSGSTAQPKGIAIAHRALMANVDDILRHGLRVVPQDRAFSWLPYYHDMGLVGLLLAPICGQVSVDYLAPSSFVRRPHVWLALMERQGSTITYAPGFAYALAARRLPPGAPVPRLHALRIAGVGGDQVHAAQLQEFGRALAPQGFDMNAFKPSYGLAEATLAVTMCDAPFDRLQRHFAIGDDGAVREVDAAEPAARALVSCGKALPGWTVTVVDAQGRPLPPLRVGGIVVKGEAQMSGLLEHGRLEAVDRSRGIETGDLGFRAADGEWFVVGRGADLVIVRGRNLWPLDLERVAAQVLGADTDDLMLLQKEGPGAELVLLVQEKAAARVQGAEHHGHLVAALVAACGAAVQPCVVANGTIERTSSGKKARGPTRARFLGGRIAHRPIFPS